METPFDINSPANKMIDISPTWMQDIVVFVFYVIVAMSFCGGTYSFIDKVFLRNFPRTKLESKLTEAYYSVGDRSIFYVFNLSVINVGKIPFYPKDWNGDINFHDVKLVLARHVRMPIREINGELINKRLKVESLRYIQSYPILRPGELVNGYVVMLDDILPEDKNIKQIVFKLSDFNGRVREIVIHYVGGKGS